MKTLPLLIISFLLCYIPLQAQQVAATHPYTWIGNLGNQEGKLCHRLSDNSFIIPEKPAKDQVDLVAYSSSFKEQWRISYKVEPHFFGFTPLNRNISKYFHPFISIDVYENKIYLLLSGKDNQLVYQILDATNGKVVSSKVIASNIANSGIEITYSPQKSHFLLSQTNASNKKITYTVYTRDGESASPVIAGFSNKEPVMGAFINDNGALHLVKKQESLFISRYSFGGDPAAPAAVGILPVTGKNVKYVLFTQSLLKGNDLYLFFDKFGATTSYILDNETLQLKSSWNFKPDEKFLKQLYSTTKNMRIWKNTKPSPPDAFLELDRVVNNSDNSLLLIYESRYFEGKSPNANSGHYKTEDIIMVCTDQEGNIRWSNYIDKVQGANSVDGFNYISYEYYRADEQTYFFFTAEAESLNSAGCYLRKLDATTGKISQPLLLFPTKQFTIRKLSCWLSPTEMIITTISGVFSSAKHTIHYLQLDSSL